VLERRMWQLKILEQATRISNAEVISHHPVSLEETQDGVDISDEVLEKAKKPPFPFAYQDNS